MVERTYVVTKDRDRMGRKDILYAGPSKEEAIGVFENCRMDYYKLIHVWEDGECVDAVYNLHDLE